MVVIREESQTTAAPELAWRLLSDVEGWPRWTASMDHVERRDAGALCVGSTALIRQPAGRPTVWEVTVLDRARRFTWQTHAPGATLVGDHVLVPLDAATRIELTLTVRGPLAWLVHVLVGRRLRRYVRMEADGLRRACDAATAGHRSPDRDRPGGGR